MKVVIKKTAAEAGRYAAKLTEEKLNEAIVSKGCARLLLSTGASQFPFFEEVTGLKVDWSKVEMFHLDEYVGISPEHNASFQKYLRERFVEKVRPKAAYLIDGRRPTEETIAELTELLKASPIDVGLIGIGENAHIAFNDPPADFEDERAYKVVTLAARCLEQQVREGWFSSVEEGFRQAVSMTCREIMKCKAIISLVPYAVKAEAVYNTLTRELTPEVPATLLKKHPDFCLVCDEDSARLVQEAAVAFV